MTRFELTIGAAALAAACFLAGRAAGPQAALAQMAPNPTSTITALERATDIVAKVDWGHLERENVPMEVRISGAVNWYVDGAGAEQMIRVQNQAGKWWYLPLRRIVWLEATPVGSPIERK